MSLRLIIFFVLLASFAAYDYMAFAPPGCANPGYKQINIHYGPSEIKVTPHQKNVIAGDALRFNLIGPAGTSVTVSPKNPLHTWLAGSGSSSKFYVCVPPGEPSDFYKYKVTVTGVGYLDPVVRIL